MKLQKQDFGVSDVSQTTGASGHEADEGRGRCGAAGPLRGVRPVPQDEQQSRYRILSYRHRSDLNIF